MPSSRAGLSLGFRRRHGLRLLPTDPPSLRLPSDVKLCFLQVPGNREVNPIRSELLFGGARRKGIWTFVDWNRLELLPSDWQLRIQARTKH